MAQKPNNRKKIDLSIVNSEMTTKIPEDFTEFCITNNLKLPSINTGNGKALIAMLNTPDYYWDRENCNKFCKKFNIDSKDSIQLFNKKEQDGFKMIGLRGKYGIKYPYEISNKKAMRKNFSYNGTESDKKKEIDNIKEHIKSNYIDIPYNEWQNGHKNPDTADSSNENFVLQPPIQGRYRDRYIFLDTLTRIPTPKELSKLIKKGESPYTNDQLKNIRDMLIELNLD